jgi:predicted RND superfamily exporter protein
MIVAILMLIPSLWGYEHTKTNYDLLTYLPDTLETVQGQDILIDEFGMGAYAQIVVENKSLKDVAKLEEDIEAIPHVKEVLWYDDVADITLPLDMVPEDLREKFVNGDATMMLAMLDNSSSDDDTMTAVRQIRETLDEDCYVSGATAILNDLSDLVDEELPIYVSIAVILSLVAMLLLTDSFVVPFLFLIDIAFAVVYNMGTNMMFGQISYITKAIAAVLQLAVTMDYSIFLVGSYRENKERFPGQNERAMGHAISNTFKSIIGSSVTTIAGFIALCFMSFTLGMDMGLVMAKGVLFGVLTCITVLPSLVLIFDKPIEKTRHKALLRNPEKPSNFITRHYIVWLVIFAVMFIPAVYGNNNVGVYYDMSGSLPSSLPSKVAAQKVEDDFGSSTIHMVLIDTSTPAKDQKNMLSEIDDVDGVNYCVGMQSIVGSEVPESMIPSNVKDLLESGNYSLALVSSEYYIGSDECNAQIEEINDIIDKYDEGGMLIGEGPLTHDLVDVTDTDFRNVTAASLLIIFAIIAVIYKSFTLPAILELVIEFAILVNMSIEFFMGTKVSFVTNIILGTVQMGSTVDYAILMTTRYQKERQRGHSRKDAVSIAHKACMSSIITSGVSFFAATFGVAMYSDIDIIHSICMMLARGALISTLVVLFVLPGMLRIFGGVIEHTSYDFLGKKRDARIAAAKEKFAQRHGKTPQPAAAVAGAGAPIGTDAGATVGSDSGSDSAADVGTSEDTSADDPEETDSSGSTSSTVRASDSSTPDSV